jgi:hypothetical protein
VGVAGARIRNCPAEVIGGLRRERLRFSLCLAGFSVGGDTLNGGTATADDSATNSKQVQSRHKNDINVSLGARYARSVAPTSCPCGESIPLLHLLHPWPRLPARRADHCHTVMLFE